MKLEVGKSYKTRNGLVVIVRRHRPEELYTFVAERGSCVYTYTAEGCYLASRQTHEFDIVVEDSPIVEVVQFRTPNGKLFDTREQAEAELEAARFVEDLRARGCPESVIERRGQPPRAENRRLEMTSMFTKIRTLARGWLHRQVQRLYPQMFADRSDLLRAAKEIGEKLKASRHECEEWRQRAFSAEDQLRAVRKATTDCIRAHNEKSGTIIPTWD